MFCSADHLKTSEIHKELLEIGGDIQGRKIPYQIFMAAYNEHGEYRFSQSMKTFINVTQREFGIFRFNIHKLLP